jgi:hypothetical protein
MVKYSLESTTDSTSFTGGVKDEMKKEDPMAHFFRQK